jgi:Ner family transcriptional regulator
MKKFTEDDHKKILGLLKFIAGSRGVRIKDLAYENGLSPSGLYACFYHPSPRTEAVVAGLIGLKPQEIWPSRYDENGKPNRPNLWHRRGTGGWTPKITHRDLKSRRKNLGDQSQ